MSRELVRQQAEALDEYAQQLGYHSSEDLCVRELVEFDLWFHWRQNSQLQGKIRRFKERWRNEDDE